MKAIRIHEADNVAVALEDLQKGETVRLSGMEIICRDDIPAGHKIALKPIAEGEAVIKYGNPIGLSKSRIEEGNHVHIHNMKTGLGDLLTYKYEPVEEVMLPKKTASFMGFERANGKAGIRNDIWIIPTMGCVNNVAELIASKAEEYVEGSVEEVIAFTHPYGCSQMGDDQENTRQILADLITHPNAGGVLVLGLGCENSNIEVLKGYLGEYEEKRVRFLTAQEYEDEVKQGVELVKELIHQCRDEKRVKLDASKLVVGLKCGGSDGLSGITANPLVGRFSDLLVSAGGTTILTEVPEMFGAETILMNRCRNEEVFNQTVCLINDFKQYFKDHHQTIYENPSPGNKAGGISTLEDKSNGCTQKSGSAKVEGVLSYAEKVEKKGLNLLSAPGNDLVAATALAASGAHLILFTTGRGTPFASPVPTMKISSNSRLGTKKSNWIDFNAGVLTEENVEMEDLTGELFEKVIRVASGEKVKSEAAGFHDMAIFKKGVTL
ncbi:MAG: altronate dehydratase [Lachnospiraceae bacterium]|nr:altronate dehydratase [Lachnospiraceae bacterium]